MELTASQQIAIVSTTRVLAWVPGAPVPGYITVADVIAAALAGVASHTHPDKADAFHSHDIVDVLGLQDVLDNLQQAIGQGSGYLSAGIIVPYAGAGAIPGGYLPCDGALYSAADYVALYDAIGDTYTVPPVSGSFRVPNLGGRVVVGSGGGYLLGAVAGESEVTLTVAQMPVHGGHFDGAEAVASGSSSVGSDRIPRQYGGSQPHNNMQPYIVSNYLISTGGV